MSEKRTRISLAQKLDIIEASKKSGFSIEDVMKKYGLKKSTVYRLLAEKEKYTQQEVNTPSSNRVKPVYSSKAPSTANIEMEKRGDLKKAGFPVDYEANKSAWMTRQKT